VLPDRKFDILINNAAVNLSDEEVHKLTEAEWTATLAVNLTAPFLTIKQCIPHMRRARWGRVVNISSIFGVRGVERRAAYCATKHALGGLTKVVAKENARFGITCNDICPGPIKSRMMNRIASEAVAHTGDDPASYLASVAEEIPAGRLAYPEDLSAVAAFLTSDLARHINGASIIVDGAYSC